MKKILSTMRLILSVLILCCCFIANAGDNFSKQQKETAKQLKKQLDAQFVSPFPNAPDAPYYRVVTKNQKSCIVDQAGRMILPQEFDMVMYFPPYNGTTVTLSFHDEKGKSTGRILTIPTQPTPEGFWGMENWGGTRVYDKEGREVASFAKPLNVLFWFGNYVWVKEGAYPLVEEYSPKFIGSDYLLLSSMGYMDTEYKPEGLARTDGSVMVHGFEQLYFENGSPYANYLARDDDNAKVKGMKCLDGSTFDIPARFADIIPIPSKDGWKVKQRTTDKDYVIYDPSKEYATERLDKGEVLYNNRQFDAVLDYYATEGIDAPWAKFFSASSLVNKYLWDSGVFEQWVIGMENGEGLPTNEAYLLGQVKLMPEAFSTAVNMLDAYLASDDQNFRTQAVTERNVAKEKLDKINDCIKRYDRVRGHAAMVTAQQKAKRDARMEAVLNAFANAMSAFASSATSTSNKSVSGTGYDSSGSSTAVSASSTEEKPDNTNRKIFLKNQIIDWKHKLKKAEASLEAEIASGEDTREKKRVVESKRNIVNDCLQMIRQYEAELNSLK